MRPRDGVDPCAASLLLARRVSGVATDGRPMDVDFAYKCPDCAEL